MNNSLFCWVIKATYHPKSVRRALNRINHNYSAFMNLRPCRLPRSKASEMVYDQACTNKTQT